MRAGPCAGVTGTGDCVNAGWSPEWDPMTFIDQVTTLAAGQIVCPFCMVWRAENARLPGFNRNKRDRILAILAGFNCMRAGGSRSTGHTHHFDFQNEDLLSSRPTSGGG